MQIDRHAERALRGGDAGDVIDVRVRQQDVANRQAARARRTPAAPRTSSPGSMSTASLRLLAADDEAVLEERTDGLTSQLSWSAMILAVLDDLMFSSKIKTAANQLGVDLRFSRSVDGAIETMRKNPTTLVIFDLNNERIGPLAIVAAMKQDPALASIPTVGYASHVQTDVIDAARQAGVGEVLARSAFVQQLGRDPDAAGLSRCRSTMIDVLRARRRIAPYVRRTPLVRLGLAVRSRRRARLAEARVAAASRTPSSRAARSTP